MTTTCVVQARTSSTRLPGKVLADLCGRPLLAFMLERLRPLAVEQLVVATSSLPADDRVAEVARSAGASVVRGPHHDVLARFIAVLDAHPADVVVRLTADCPLVDPALVEDALGLLGSSASHYASNTLVRTFPDGLDVEVLRSSILREADAEATDPFEREHVTPFVYRRPDRYRLVSLTSGEALAALSWTVDTQADLDRVRRMVAALEAPATAGWREILAVAEGDVRSTVAERHG